MNSLGPAGRPKNSSSVQYKLIYSRSSVEISRALSLDQMVKTFCWLPSFFFFFSLFILPLCISSSSPSKDHQYKILSRSTLHSGWRQVEVRKILNTATNSTADFEVFSQKHPSAVTVLPFDTRTKTFSLVREYQPGSNRVMYGPAAGLVEELKHGSSPDRAAREEVLEECNLRNGTLVRLSNAPIVHDKYSTTPFDMYLLLDGVKAGDERDRRDVEEKNMGLEAVHNIKCEELKRYLMEGDLNLVGVATVELACRHLIRQKYLDNNDW